jgi:hypothetical protein
VQGGMIGRVITRREMPGAPALHNGNGRPLNGSGH